MDLRDDSTLARSSARLGFKPNVLAASSAGDHCLARYLAVPLAWRRLVDAWFEPKPRTAGFASYAWNSPSSQCRHPLTSATCSRWHRHALDDGSYLARLLVMGYLFTLRSSDEKIEYREIFAAPQPLAMGASATPPLWTRRHERAPDRFRDPPVNRLFAIALAVAFLASPWALS